MSVLAAELADAARLVARVAGGGSLSTLTARGALIDFTHGTLRRYGRVQAIVRELSRRGPPEALVQALLWCALYALESRRYADYTVVDQAVAACRILERWNAKGYVNAVLRGYLRERGSLEARIQADAEARYQHPRWWIEHLQHAYPSGWEQILAAGNAHPPMCLRVNPRRTSVEEFAKRVNARRLGAQALLLDQPMPIERVPGFDAGEVSVQDAGAQRAAPLLELGAGMSVLDACAAPGGKSGHILELADVALTALDVDAARCERLERNLARLGVCARVVNADCTHLAEWWDGTPFDRILADVPCTASGIVRRHPDIKWLRRAADIAAFAARQGAILDALWQALCPGGKLLYATCSVFPQENDAVIEAFLARAARARRAPLADAGAPQGLPDAERDGFYYALIEKQA